MANQKFQNALTGVAQKCPPIWMMRQAGRYHSHYQKLKQSYSFIDLCKNPKLAAETALGPIQDFDFDVSILFSDLLFPLEALGMGLKYDPGPKLDWQLSDSNYNKLQLTESSIDRLAFQKEAMEETRKVLPEDKSLIGFVGGPWTLFTYATEGAHKGQLLAAKSSIELFQRFCEVYLPLMKQNIQLQIDGGAEVVVVMDTAVGEISPLQFKQWIVPALAQVCQSFDKKIAYYTKGTTPFFFESKQFEAISFVGMGFDHRWDLKAELKREKPGFVQGNFDQALMCLEENQFNQHLNAFIEDFKHLNPEERKYWVCGVGHGLTPFSKEANVRKFVQSVREQFQ